MNISPQQLLILERLANGEKRASIATSMELSLGTVNDYIDRLYRRLDAHTAAQALANYFRAQHSQLELFARR